MRPRASSESPILRMGKVSSGDNGACDSPDEGLWPIKIVPVFYRIVRKVAPVYWVRCVACLGLALAPAAAPVKKI